MKSFGGFERKLKSRGYEQLPAGAYVARIKAVKIDGQEPDQRLVLRLDIDEGPYKEYYTKRYMHDTKNSNGKYKVNYKGDFRIRIPNEDNKNARYPEQDLKNWGDFIAKIEMSNPGYEWDWEEQGLRGKLIGVSVQQGTYNGAMYTSPKRLEVVDDVRMGRVNMMEPMAPRSDASYDPPVDQSSGFAKVETDELPF